MAATGGVSYSWMPTTGLSCSTCSSTTITPSSTTTYTVTGTDAAGCTNSDVTTVDANRISGNITIGGTSTSLRVWLVQFNPVDSSIIALDSTMACLSGGTPYYEFMDPTPGNYLVKATLTTAIAGTSDYIPTYGSSTAYWYMANNITHGTGTDNQNITMIYGTVPSGPGFISGYVYSGAGRGTADVPAVGLLMYLKDAAGNVLTYTYTDASGAYTFSGIAYGNYVIYPEGYDFATLPSPTINLSASSAGATGINFRQYTTSRIIKPIAPSIVHTTTAHERINVFPNPTTGYLTVQWPNQAVGSAEVVIIDAMGREAFKSNIQLGATTETHLDITSLKAGIYQISIGTGNNFYSSKLEKLE
jgi:hypothetical protein